MRWTCPVRLRSSASLAAGLERLARYGRVLSDRVAARMEAQGEGLLLLVRDTGSTALHPARAEFALAVALKFVRDSAGGTSRHCRYASRIPRQRQSRNITVLSRTCHFAANSNSMIFSAVDAARPLQGADDALH